jgi:hypothetical protein
MTLWLSLIPRVTLLVKPPLEKREMSVGGGSIKYDFLVLNMVYEFLRVTLILALETRLL